MAASDCEVAWAAGLFEGEGCITFDAADARAQARINMVDPEPLHRFAAIIGIGKVYGPYTQKAAGHSPYYAWHARNDKAFAAMEILRPWLSERRLARLAEVEELARTRKRTRLSGSVRQRLAREAREAVA